MAKRKYAHLNLPRMPRDEEGDHRARVREFKTAVGRGKTTTALVTYYAEVRRAMDKIKEEKTSIQVKIDGLTEMIVDSFEEEGVTSLKLEGGDTVRVDVKPIPGMKDREKFRLWCLEQGFEKEMHLHYMTAQSLVCQMLLEGKPEPPGVEAFMGDTIKFTKG
jgi:hypothetical protein